MNDTFQPMGNSLLITVSTVASAPIQLSTGNVYGFRVVNSSTSDIYIAVGVSTATAAYPSTAGAASIYISGSYRGPEYFKCSGRAYLSAISTVASVTGTLNVTPGMKL